MPESNQSCLRQIEPFPTQLNADKKSVAALPENDEGGLTEATNVPQKGQAVGCNGGVWPLLRCHPACKLNTAVLISSRAECMHLCALIIGTMQRTRQPG